MAPGGSTFKEVLESHSTVSDYDIAIKSESTSTVTKTSPGLGGKNGVYSTNGVHELLECPVCTSLMYPPIHQVCLQFAVPTVESYCLKLVFHCLITSKV